MYALSSPLHLLVPLIQLQVLLFYAAVRFSMVVSDTTGNVKKCRALICTLYPWILNCPDPCHQLNLLAKDIIVGSKGYPENTRLCDSKCNYGKKHLRDKLKNEEDRRGLVSFGQTRFSTFGNQSSSVPRCLPAMEQCYAEGLIKFDTKALYNINMLKPISRGLETLESSQVTCSDVFNIWIGLGIGFKQVLTIQVCPVTTSSVLPLPSATDRPPVLPRS
ncbi:hypothetical protein B0H10DRAFT_1816329 [Mycena sp. CBHHK59/15]|nr:hypothetical protein B0H10DRAFT_1816329 [Mycena sp. CBHHK59/15]